MPLNRFRPARRTECRGERRFCSRCPLELPADDVEVLPCPGSAPGHKAVRSPLEDTDAASRSACLVSFCNGLQTYETALGGLGGTERHERAPISARHGTGRHQTAPDGTAETRLRA